MTVTLGDGLIVSNDLWEFLNSHAKSLRIARYLLDGWVAHNIIRLDLANHLDAVEDGEDAGKLGYLPPNRWERHKNENRYWDHDHAFAPKGRMRGKAGSIIKKVLKDEAFTQPIRLAPWAPDHAVDPLTDEDVLHFATALQASFKAVEPFIVTGEAIRYWYYEGNYTQTGARSMLHTSCMRYGENRSAMRFYAQNPKVIGMACILGSDEKLAARALLWNTPSGILMDRRYGTDAHRRSLVNWAIKHGWHYRTHNDAGEYHITSPEGKVFSNVAVPLQRSFDGSEAPYFDTVQRSDKIRASGDCRYERLPAAYQQERTNPYLYGYVAFGDYPPEFLASVDYGRASESTRNRRVEFLTDFSWLTPWPEEVLRSDPAWQLEDPENDEENAALPVATKKALVLAAPPPTNITPWIKTGTKTDYTYELHTTHLDAIRALMGTLEQPTPPLPRDPLPVMQWIDDGYDAGIEMDEPWP